MRNAPATLLALFWIASLAAGGERLSVEIVQIEASGEGNVPNFDKPLSRFKDPLTKQGWKYSQYTFLRSEKKEGVVNEKLSFSCGNYGVVITPKQVKPRKATAELVLTKKGVSAPIQHLDTNLPYQVPLFLNMPEATKAQIIAIVAGPAE